MEPSEIAKFYVDKSIFVTGATGFVGKVLVEKLLRSCAHLKKIYVLVRPKKGDMPDQRLSQLLNSPVCIIFRVLAIQIFFHECFFF